MLRAVLLGVLSLSVAACGSKDEPAKVTPGAPAGKVVEVGGAVTARRGEATRKLVAGDTVSGDDAIETGADGHVRIELAHNGVKMDLGPGKRTVVSESLAWKQPKAEIPAKTVEQASSAAGRPAERSAAETTITADTTARADEAVHAGSKGAVSRNAVGSAPRAEAERSKEVAAAVAAPSPPPPPPPPAPEPEAAPAPPALQPTAPGGGSTPPPPKQKQADVDTASGGGGHNDTVDSEGGGGMRPTKPPVAAAAPMSNEMLAARQLRNSEQLLACLTTATPAITLTVTTGADRKPTTKIVAKAKVAASLANCVDTAVKKLSLPASTTATVELAK